MSHPGAHSPHELEPPSPPGGPPLPRGLDTEHTRPPRPLRRSRRRGPAWALLAFAAVTLVAGVALPQGLLLATGLVTAGMATHLLTAPSPRVPDRHTVPLPAPARPGDDRHHR
ncbi:hypothetical protein [Streptomyces sp. NPDC101166]|uniref:hypothetical protein n=1 Tax=Streptomyces sp. NPDC101166 TaxID=3366120 RepID=UPI003827677A